MSLFEHLHQSERWDKDPDPHQSGKRNPDADTHQGDADLQHCISLWQIIIFMIKKVQF
jgi:hypothetical protein